MPTKVRKLGSSLPASKDEILTEWRVYFDKLLNNINLNTNAVKHSDPEIRDLRILTSVISS